MTTYKIVRIFRNDNPWEPETIKTDLTLEEAKEHCKDPETSSRTATSDEAVRLTQERGPWMDGFYEE